MDDASKAITQAKAQLAQAEKQLAAAQSDYAAKQAHAADVQAKLQVATVENDQAQAALQAAEANLAKAKADVVAGQAALDAQQARVKDTVVALYQQGSPQLMAWTGYLDAQTPDDLIRKMEYADTLVEDQNSLFDQLHAAEVALHAQKDAVKTAEAAADEQADVAAQELNNVEQLSQQADEAVQRGDAGPEPGHPHRGRPRRRRSTRRSGPRSATARSCATSSSRRTTSSS